MGETAAILREPFVDQTWYDLARPAAGLDNGYKLLTPPKEESDEAFDQFEAGEIDRPNLRPTSLPDTLPDQVASLQQAKEAIIQGESDEVLAWAWRWRINELLGNAAIANAALVGDAVRFERYNYFVYGDVDPAIAALDVAFISDFAEKFLDDHEPKVRAVAEHLGSRLDQLQTSHVAAELTPDADTFQTVQAHQAPYFEQLFAGVDLPSEGKVAGDFVWQALRQVLQNINAPHRLVPSDTAAMGVVNARAEFEVPAKPTYSVERFKGLTGHEAKHMLEYINAQSSRYGLFVLGLDRYEPGTEGKGVAIERLPYDQPEAFTQLRRQMDILKRHFVVSLATGAYGSKASFDDIYHTIHHIEILQQRSADTTRSKDFSILETQARKRTRALLRRLLKGTDADMASQGATCYRKDMVYAEGEIAWWAAVRRDPRLLDHMDETKYNIANPRHLAILSALGAFSMEGGK
ncbi:MAG TPA: hypothetical protein VLF60_00220 [Candidatus Saccharimonadales bacterium]|nr:hypothetical protein [Candidatus Saccharimonadales bacterium]